MNTKKRTRMGIGGLALLAGLSPIGQAFAGNEANISDPSMKRLISRIIGLETGELKVRKDGSGYAFYGNADVQKRPSILIDKYPDKATELMDSIDKGPYGNQDGETSVREATTYLRRLCKKATKNVNSPKNTSIEDRVSSDNDILSSGREIQSGDYSSDGIKFGTINNPYPHQVKLDSRGILPNREYVLDNLFTDKFLRKIAGAYKSSIKKFEKQFGGVCAGNNFARHEKEWEEMFAEEIKKRTGREYWQNLHIGYTGLLFHYSIHHKEELNEKDY